MARTSAKSARRWAILPLSVLPAACLVTLVVAAIYVLPDRLVTRDVGTAALEQLKPSELLKAKDDVRKTLLQGIGGLLFLATAFFTWRQLQISRGQLQISRESQITEQFNKAIEHLGSEQVDVRLGGIYALERIASISERERGPIVEVLTAYVREHAPTPALRDDPPDPATLPAPKADVQAAMIVLARRVIDERHGDDLDLSGVDLRRAYLASPKVMVARFRGVNLQEALLQASNLQAADLRSADMWQVDLRWSNLKSANLHHAYLREGDLREAELQGADLRETRLQGADLRGANLNGARLDGAQANQATRWPDGFADRAVAAGVRFLDD
jgi:hypothetical protein